MEGQFLGYLGLLHARQARAQDAWRCLQAGEAFLRTASDSFGLGVLLCGRAEAHLIAGEGEAAAAALSEAASLAAEAGTGPASELGLALAHVHALIDPSGA